MTGIVPSEEFNEQIKRTVRETIRRQRTNVGPAGRWHKKGGSGGGGVIEFTIDSPSSMIGRNATGCDWVDATVDIVGCGTSGVSVGDEVRIWDPKFCHFNYPIDLLVGIGGTAHQFQNPIDDIDLENLVDCEEDVLAAGPCRWVVVHTCCAEEYPF